ncbi:MAG: hypothetical protein ACI921_000617, partial [Polaribacter sp.]
RKSFAIKYNIPKQLNEQLKKVRERLMNGKKYYEISKNLPELKQRAE